MSMKLVNTMRTDWAKNDAIRDAGLKTPEDIQRFDDISYGPYKENVLDVYQPIHTSTQLPTIISIHGGGWCYGDKQLYQHYCMRLAQRGFSVVNFTYRLAPENKYPAALTDIFNVFKWVKENYSNYCIDYNNLFLVGDSAGGQLACQVSTILTNPEFAKLFDISIPEGFKVNAVGLNCGRYNVKLRSIFYPVYKKSLLADYLPNFSKEIAKQMDLFSAITSDFPATFVMSAKEDFLLTQAEPLYRLLQKKKVDSVLHIYGEKGRKDIGHVFHVNCKLDEAVKCNDDECNFFKEHLKK